MSTINSRIKKLREYYCEDSNATFANRLGVSKQAASNYIRDGYNIGKSVIEQILNTFPEAGHAWLLTGEGEMLKKTEVKLITSETLNGGVPYYENIDVSGGIIPMFNDTKETPTFFINYPHFNDCTAYLPVVGDSMYPKYASGEIIAVKQIFNLDMIQWGEAYLIVGNENTDGLRTIKLIHPNLEDDSRIILRASNPNFKGDTPIYKKDIISIFIVKGKITRNQM